jgi:hypothetical protein
MFHTGTPITTVQQYGSGDPRLTVSRNTGRAARVNYGDIQQGGTMGWGKGHLKVDQRPLTASRGNTHRCCSAYEQEMYLGESMLLHHSCVTGMLT